MKVFVENNLMLNGVVRRLVLEGDEVVRFDPLLDEYDLPKDGLVIKSVTPIQTASVDEHDVCPEYAIGVYAYSGHAVGRPFLIIPCKGMMNNGIGSQVTVLCATRVIEWNARLEEEFRIVLSASKQNSENGFFFVQYSGTTVTHVGRGLPWLGMYCVFEQIGKKKISQWMIAGGELLDSWAIASLVTRAPWPYEDSTKKPVVIEDVTPEVEKHLWFLCSPPVDEQITTEQTAIAVATGWHPDKIHTASSYVLYSCEKLNIHEVQYRTDVKFAIQDAVVAIADFVPDLRDCLVTIPNPR